MGAGVSTMHYTGMAAMQMSPAIQYDRGLVLLSVCIAVVASGAALWLAFRSASVLVPSQAAARRRGSRHGLCHRGHALHGHGGRPDAGEQRLPRLPFRHGFLVAGRLVIVSTLGGLAVVLLTSVIDMRLETRTAVLAASLANANQELTYLALHDNLTKLPNRLLLEDRLNQAIQATRRTQRLFSVMFLDLDGFKAVNDAFGHHVGDSLWPKWRSASVALIRASDTLARIGGDEFVLLADLAEPTSAAGPGR